MSFKRITIIGLGLIGGSFAAAIKRKKIETTIAAVDFADVVQKARSLNIVDKAYEVSEIAKAVQDADLVFISTPVTKIIEIIKAMSPYLQPGTLVTDVGSTKVQIVGEANRYLPDNVYFLGGHPMAGAAKGGVESADPLLFENAIYVLTKTENIPQSLVGKYADLIETIGAKVVFLTQEQHDKIAATVSHMPHILAVTLMNYVARLNTENPAYLNLAAGGFRDMTRIASSPFDIWQDIIKTNQKNILEVLEQFIEELQAIKSKLTEPNIKLIFENAAKSRLSIPKDTRGFLRPHYDLFVVVEDKPGVIASIANTLAGKDINIKDIEVVKIREGDAGTLRLSFETENNRSVAITLLEEADFITQIKD